MTLLPTLRRFSVQEYYRMAEAAVLGTDERVELLDGQIFLKRQKTSRYAGLRNRMNRLFSLQLAAQAILSPQNPVHLDDFSEPEPDLTLLRFRDDFYAKQHPRPEDVLLLVETESGSPSFEQKFKMPLYARAGIRESWIVDLEGRRLLVFRQPGPDGYGNLQTLSRGQRIAPVAFPDFEVAVDQLLG